MHALSAPLSRQNHTGGGARQASVPEVTVGLMR